MFLRSVVVTAALAFSALSASAAPLAYECDVTAKGRSQGQISDWIQVFIGQNGQVTVIDGLILIYKNEPIIAKVTKSTYQILKLRWTLRDIRTTSNQLANVNSEAILNKKTNKVTVRSAPANWPGNRFSGKGTCKVPTK